MSEPHVSRETDDEQTGQHAEGSAPAVPPQGEDDRMIADLQRVYHRFAVSNARSLEDVQARLEQRGARLARSRSASPQPDTFPPEWPSEEHAVKSPVPLPRQVSAWRKGISTLVAVLVLAVLVGSMVTVFTLARPGNGTANPSVPSSASTPTVQSSPTPTEAPPPPATPGVYIDIENTFGNYQIAKIDPQTREVLWKQDVGSLTSYPLIVYGNTVYMSAGDPTGATYDTYVYALDATSGAVRWKVTFPSNTTPNDNSPILNVLDAPTIDNGTLYVGDRAGKLYALNATTGSRLWTYTALASGIILSPVTHNYTTYDPNPAAVANGVVYDSIFDELYAVDANTGKLLWMKKIEDTQLLTTPVLANGVLYTTSTGPYQVDYTYAFAARDGKLLWKDNIGGSELIALTIEQGTIYLDSYDNTLYALKASDGSQLWRFNTGGPIYDTPILENGTVYVDGVETSSTATVFAVDASSGTLVWQKVVEGLSGLWAVQDGVIYIGVWPGELLTLSATDGSVLWHQKFGPTLIDKTGTESEAAPIITVIG